jgi:hypothetical protein
MASTLPASEDLPEQRKMKMRWPQWPRWHHTEVF